MKLGLIAFMFQMPFLAFLFSSYSNLCWELRTLNPSKVYIRHYKTIIYLSCLVSLSISGAVLWSLK